MRTRSLKDYDPFEHAPDSWPGKKNSVSQHGVTRKQFGQFERLISSKASESDIERFFGDNREILSMAVWMFDSGHHMSWIFPKEQIRPPSGDVGGMIPDYLMAGANSAGVEWFVLELKGADKRAFTKRGKRVTLSAEANGGVCQLLSYIDRSSHDQSYLRDGLGLRGFREPRGILLLGTDDETVDQQVADFKNAWNRINTRMQIRSYNALARQVQRKLKDFNR